MKLEQAALRLGAAILAGAILLRLFSGISQDSLHRAELARLLIFLQTGRIAQADTPEPTAAPTEPPTPETPETLVSTEPDVPSATFSAEDAGLIQLRNTSGCPADPAYLVAQSLAWELTGDAPTVLILHTHGTESYAGNDSYRSSDPERNMIAVGSRLAAALEQAGIRVIHDRTAYDADSYNGSYAQARAAITRHLAENPSIRLVLDLHRDAAEDASGRQIDYTVATPQGEAAKLMLVMGTDAGGLSHPNWQQNLSLACQLQVSLERICPDVCRPMYVRTSRFNQDLSPGALLIEVGAAGNTLEEALLATDILAQGLLALAHGANT